MKTRNTILLLLIATGVYFFLRDYEQTQPTTQEAEEISGHVVQMEHDKVDGIDITNNETKIELRKRNNQWDMDAPIKDRADGATVETLLSSIEDFEKETTLKADGGKTDLKDLGLVKPNVTLQLLGDGAPPEILFGKDTAIEGKEYVKLANSDDVFVVANDLRTQVTKAVDDFRDHQLSNTGAAQVDKVDIKSGAGEMELQKDHDHWQINKPIKARGDDEKISDLVAQTLNTKVDSFVSSDQAGAATTALNDAAGSVTFSAEGADKPVVLQLSKPIDKQPGKVYARLSSRDADLVLSGSVNAILDTKPNDVRDRHLIRLNLDTVDRIHVTPPPGGAEILLARKGEDWTIKSMGDKPANSGAVQTMVSALQNTTATAFVSDVATELARYGLDTPQLKVTFSSYATDNTAETKAGEEPIETISFGMLNGQNVFAKLDDEPFIITVPKSVLDNIYTDPLKWQTLGIFDLKPEDIVGMDVTADGQATLSLVKEKGVWKPAKGDIGLNTANIEAIATTLSTLRATDWAGAKTPEQGLDKPAATITVTMADKKMYTVKVGAAAGDYWDAEATGFDGTFLINKTDHDSLTAAVLPGAPAASPAATGTDAGKN